jgi:competence ComEA-like helix-hairpin-helix protein
VKQNLRLTNYPGSPITLVLLALVLVTSACATRPRNSSAAVQFNPDVPLAKRASVININTASPQELEKLPGVGKVIAERIAAQREQYGPFRRAEHLMMVRGISDRKFRAIRPMIVVE